MTVPRTVGSTRARVQSLHSALLLSLACALVVPTPGCGTSPQMAATRQEMALLTLETVPADARIYIDGVFVATTSEIIGGGLPVPVTARRLELRSEGYHPHRRDLDLEPERTYTLRVSLVRNLE